jgi:hydrogenase nickel incorporation protein HypA/HybF
MVNQVHELAITQNILDIVLKEADAAQASKVTRVNIVIGELSGVVRESVEFYFDFIKKDNAAEHATINFKEMPAVLKCRDCSTEFTPQGTSWSCPNCQSSKMEVTAGRDCFVESIEVEE